MNLISVSEKLIKELTLIDVPNIENDIHITINGLSVFMQGKSILKNINLCIPRNKITCILGPSGCGKTTLLRSLIRFHDDNDQIKVEGSIRLGNVEIYSPSTEVTTIRKKMGLLSQKPTVLPFSIYDNVAYGPRLYGIRQRRKVYEIVKHQLQAVGLWDEVKTRIKTPAVRLSIGQQQRLCLARGLAVEPEIILGDEATSALDPISTVKIEELFLKMKEMYSIVLVTHTINQAKRIADYVAFMYLGELIEFGKASEVLNTPKHPLTQQYLRGSFS